MPSKTHNTFAALEHMEMTVQDFQLAGFNHTIHRKFNVVFTISDCATERSDPTATEGGATNVQEEETPVNPPATDQMCVASTSTNSADS
jgi:hypothetical protein